MIGKITATILLSTVCTFGDADALYKQGAGLFKSDPAQALELFEQAAGEGNVSAMVGAGHCYETGTGVKVDYAKAIEFYEQAVKQNSLKACEGLARIYASCPNPEFHDGEKSVKFAGAIARKNPRDPEALQLLSSAYLRDMQPAEAVYAVNKAVKYASSIKQAKELKEKLPAYEQGQPEPAKATEEWIMLAAEKEVEWAVVELVHMTADPSGKMYNPQLAVLMCEKGIDMGRTELHLEMGRVHFNEGRLGDAYKSFCATAKVRQFYKGKKPIEISYYPYLVQTPTKVFDMAGKLKTGYSKTQNYTTTETRTGYDAYGRPYDYDVNVTKTRTVEIKANPEGSRFLYEIAAKMGHVEAQRMVVAFESTSQSGKPTSSSIIKDAEKFLKGKDKAPPKALAMLTDAYEKNPNGAVAAKIGVIYMHTQSLRDIPQAEAWVTRAADGNNTSGPNSMSLFFSANKTKAFLDGEKAVKYALMTIDVTGKDDWVLDTLACAYARNGQFGLAVETQEDACKKAKKSGSWSEAQMDGYKFRLELFKQNRAWVKGMK